MSKIHSKEGKTFNGRLFWCFESARKHVTKGQQKSGIRGNIHTLPTFVPCLPWRTLVTVPGSLVTRRVVVTLPRAFGTPCRVGILFVVAIKTLCEKNIFMFDNWPCYKTKLKHISSSLHPVSKHYVCQLSWVHSEGKKVKKSICKIILQQG